VKQMNHRPETDLAISPRTCRRALPVMLWLLAAMNPGCEVSNWLGRVADGGVGSGEGGTAGAGGGGGSGAAGGGGASGGGGAGGAVAQGGAGGGGPRPTYYYSLSYSSEHNRLAVSGNGGVMLFDPMTGSKLRTIDPGTGFAALVRQGGNLMAAVHLENLWLFDGAGALQRTIPHPYQVFSLAMSADGSVLVSGDIAGRVRRFRTGDGSEILPALAPNSEDFVSDVDVAADGLHVAVALKEGVRIWRMVDGALVTTIPGNAGYATFAPNGREIAVVGDLGLAGYTVPGGAKVMSHSGILRSDRLAYSADGHKLAVSVNNNKDIRIFDTTTATEIVTLFDNSELHPPEPAGFRDVSEMAFVAQDSRLVVAWRSGRLAAWRVEDGTLLFSRLNDDPN
jgi:WD40 repeat protein